MSVMKRLFIGSHVSVRGAVQLYAISPAYCAIRTERGGDGPRSLIFMKHPPAASSAELGCASPWGIKKGPPRLFPAAVPLFFSSDSGRFRRLSGSGSSCRTEEARFLLQQAFDKLHTVHMVRTRLHKLFQLAHPLKTKSGVPGRAALSPEPGCSSSHSSI